MKHKEGRVENLAQAMDRYKSTAAFFKDHVPVMILIFLLSVLQRFVLFGATWFVYRSFGLTGTSLWRVLILQASHFRGGGYAAPSGGYGRQRRDFPETFRPWFSDRPWCCRAWS